jgi:molybdopterin/thiamine biosynthesis adenylyltransferase
MQNASVEDPAALQSGPPPILGSVAGAMGCLQALEALTYLTGIGKRSENPDCPVCRR